MKGIWQRGMLILLAVALAAAFTLGQQGLTASEWQEKYGKLDETEGAGTNEKGKTEGLSGDDKNPDGEKQGGTEESAFRVHREGKVLPENGKKSCIVIDAGHGGYDPGKIGINDAMEKDVNLAIACLLRDYLEAAGARVVMTRQTDASLGEEGEGSRKVRDLKERIRIIEAEKPDLAVSIHQNSYPEEYVSGAQVFYYQTSKEGQGLAQAIQERLVRDLDPQNDRQVKENGSYYLLKKTSVPLVIVECGFLSNWSEAEKLCGGEYQDAVAWTIYLGIMDYLEQREEKKSE